MIPRLLIPLSLAAGLLLCGCEKKTPAAATTGSPVVAQAGDDVITVEDVEKEVQRRIARNLNIPDKTVLVQEMLERLAAVSRAKKAKLDEDAETRREMENVLIAKLRAQEVQAKVEAIVVSDEELKAAFDAGAGGHARAAKVRLAILRMQGDPAMSEGKRAELKSRMEEALQKAAAAPAEGGRGGAALGFGQVAAEYSDDQVSRYRGGDIGWLDAGSLDYHQWPKSVLETGYSLEKGKCSAIIEDKGSLFAVMKTDSRDGTSASFEETKASLRSSLLKKKRASIEASFLSENRSQTGAEVRAGVLSTLTLPAVPARPAPVADSTPPALPGMNPPSR